MSRPASRARPPNRPGNALRVEDVMVRALAAVAHNATLATTWSLMRSKHIRHLPVLDGERRLVGIVTDHDLRQVMLDPSLQEEPGKLASVLERLRVNEVMTWAVITVSPGTELREAARIMHERKVGALVVAEHGGAVGMLTATDVLEALLSTGVRRGRRSRRT